MTTTMPHYPAAPRSILETISPPTPLTDLAADGVEPAHSPRCVVRTPSLKIADVGVQTESTPDGFEHVTPALLEKYPEITEHDNAPSGRIAQYVKVVDCAIPFLLVKYSNYDDQLPRRIDLYARPMLGTPSEFDDIIMETSERHDLPQQRINGLDDLQIRADLERYQQSRLKEQYCRRRQQEYLRLAQERRQAADWTRERMRRRIARMSASEMPRLVVTQQHGRRRLSRNMLTGPYSPSRFEVDTTSSTRSTRNDTRRHRQHCFTCGTCQRSTGNLHNLHQAWYEIPTNYSGYNDSQTSYYRDDEYDYEGSFTDRFD
ncbi:hypothetical protein BJY52DRAFT_305793 [Lactarius psammicola]|nr:hypothetical protein BJY52DRAFT_305793 [Lactarius psammicola]